MVGGTSVGDPIVGGRRGRRGEGHGNEFGRWVAALVGVVHAIVTIKGKMAGFLADLANWAIWVMG
jgi:hypothetical protein